MNESNTSVSFSGASVTRKIPLLPHPHHLVSEVPGKTIELP